MAVCRRARDRVTAAPALCLLLLIGCGRGKGPGTTTPDAPAETPPRALRVEPLVPLLPDRPTHVAAAEHLVAWVQEAEAGNDIVYLLSDAGVPAASGLTSRAVADALGLEDARGHLQSIDASDGEIYFAYVGQAGRGYAAAVGRFRPADRRLQILADGDGLRAATGAGAALAAAQAQVIAAGDTLWVYFAAIDRGWLVQADLASLPAEGPAAFAKPFDAPAVDVAADLPLSEDDYRVGGSPAGDLLVTDLRRGAIWRLSPAGVARPVRWLLGLPRTLSAPGFDEAGQPVVFAAEGRPLLAIPTEHPPEEPLVVDYPALLRFEPGGRVQAIPRDRFLSDDQVAAWRLRPAALATEPGGQSWIAYDPPTGRLVRLRSVTPP